MNDPNTNNQNVTEQTPDSILPNEADSDDVEDMDRDPEGDAEYLDNTDV